MKRPNACSGTKFCIVLKLNVETQFKYQHVQISQIRTRKNKNKINVLGRRIVRVFSSTDFFIKKKEKNCKTKSTMGKKSRKKRKINISKWDNIDEEWAESLVGLPMRVRGRWWAGIDKDDKNKLFNGHLEKYDKSIARWYLKKAGKDDLFVI